MDVTGLDRRIPAPALPGHHIVADLLDIDLDELVDRARSVDVVFHLAGRGGVRDTDPCAEAHWWRDNVLATERLVGSLPIGVPLVVTSSSSVYGGAERRGDRLR